MQTFHQWQQSPQQGTVPSVPSDSEQLEIVEEKLLDTLAQLQFCHIYLETSRLSKRYSALFTAVSDALNATSEAIERCDDAPDEPYDVALEQLSPINGKVQPTESAF
jgi:hypothetical protein